MRLTLPAAYLGHFSSGKVYVSRLQKRAVLLMNRTENDKLAQVLENSRVDCKDGIVRFVRAGIIESKVVDGEVDVPSDFAERLEGDERSFSQEKLGIVVL